MKISGKRYRWGIDDICWILVICILTWQIFLSRINSISHLALLLLFTHNLWTCTKKVSDQKDLLKIGICILMLVAYSIILANEGGYIIRFSLIMSFVCYAYYIRMKNPRNIIKGLVYVTVPFAILLIFLELFFLFIIDKSSAHELRMMCQEAQLGDIYRHSDGLYHIQLKGAPILPFIYMLIASTTIFRKRVKYILCTLYLLASIFAGNFMYLMAFVAFHMMYLLLRSRSRNYLYNHLPVYIAILCVLPILIAFIGNTLEEKKDFSNRVRIEQVQLLLEDMTESPITILFGKGLGNSIDASTSMRSYNKLYYEVQTVYFLNQLGIVPFLIFVVYNILCTRKFITSRRLHIVYCSYVIYAISNPYILDTNQVVVIISLLCADQIENNRLDMPESDRQIDHARI